MHPLLRESGLSYSQVPIWVGQKLHADSPLYNMAFAFVFEGAIDAAAFREAWIRVIASSDALRTSVDERQGLAVRRVRDAGEYDSQIADFGSHPEPEVRFLSWARERCRRTLPLDGPLVDSVLVKLSDDRYGWYLNQHHLVTDASSAVLLVRQVADEYAACLGRVSSVAAPLAPYYTTVQSLASYPDARTREEAARYWHDQLETADRAVSFYGRRSRASGRSERLRLVLDERVSQRLRDIAEEPGFLSFTPDMSRFALFATLLACWLHRVSGSDRIGFDAPAHNRPTPAAKRSIGLYIEMFPFTIFVEPHESLRDVGRRCLEETGRFLRYALPGTGVSTGARTANVVLNYFSGRFGDFAGIPVRSDWIHAGHSDSVHALRLQVHDYDATSCYTLDFDLDDAIFPAALRQRAVRQFQKLLHAVLRDPDAPIAAVEMLDDDEREALVVAFNRTDSEPLPVDPVPVAFDRQAAATPDRTALRHGAREMSFRELQATVDRVAGQLAANGIGPGTTVAVFMRRSIEAVIAILAVLKAGSSYLPLDPAYPEERVRHILDDAGAPFVLVSGGLACPVTSSRTTIVDVDDLLNTPTAAAPPAIVPRLSDLAYIIYTSGSTGEPKGVPIEHGGLADYLEWAARQYVRGESLRFPLFTSLAFDLTVTSLFLPLTTGGTLVVYTEPGGVVDTALMDVVTENAVDFVKLTPSHLSLLRQLNLSGSHIRRMVVGGENLPTRLAAAVDSQLNGRAEIYNEYGPTEAVVGCAIHRYTPASDTAASVPIGRPADHVQLYVLNEALTPVPEGVPGELCISRYGLTRGYHARPEITRRRFVGHPFRVGDRLYRTGDLARFTAPGTLECLGRIDRQLKISGYRVEPAEIEAALLAHADIAECLVVPHRPRATRTPGRAVSFCGSCGIGSDVPDAALDEDGICSICRSFLDTERHTRAYFGTMDELWAILAEASARRTGPYACMMLLSGGKDSTYALSRLVERGLRVYAFTLDNGYLSTQAKENIRRVVAALGVDHEFATTPAMNAIFRDSLERFSNVCNGCFKTLYTLSMARARELTIPVIVTGLSRGQLFETRLTERLFREGRCPPAAIDEAVLAARKAYHRVEDAVSRLLDVTIFDDDRIFEEVRFVDFYRYCDAGLGEILAHLQRTVPWMRPSDTGRSTNCLINDVGIYVHQQERGYHNYALPYSWDVRLGHKTRREALEELRDEIDVSRVRRILSEIGYDVRGDDEAGSTALAAYYRSSQEIPVTELRRHLAGKLPASIIPHHFIRLDALPLSPHGKIDVSRLPPPEVAATTPEEYVPPEGPAQERIAMIWRDVLRVDRVGATASFFDLGGTSMAAMDVMLRVCDAFTVDLPLQTVFQYPTIAKLARAVEQKIAEELAHLADEEADRLADDLPPLT